MQRAAAYKSLRCKTSAVPNAQVTRWRTTTVICSLISFDILHTPLLLWHSFFYLTPHNCWGSFKVRMLKMKLVIHHFVSDSGFYNLPLLRIITDYIFTPSKDILDPMLTLELKGRPLNFKIVYSQLRTARILARTVLAQISPLWSLLQGVYS